LCGGVGFKGRLAVLETLRFNEELDDMLLGQASQHAMLEKALEQGYTSMLHNALRRVRAGETTLEEISRIVDLTELV